MPTATWNGAVLAESDATIVVEGNHYFPPDSVDPAYLRDSDRTSRCFWKGTARYKDVVIDGQVNPAAGWYYPDPQRCGRPDRRLRRLLARCGGAGMTGDPPQVGQPAPELVLPDLDGTVTALRDLRGRPVLVSFLRHAG